MRVLQAMMRPVAGPNAGAGGFPKNTGVGLGTTTATRVLSPTASTLAREKESLLAKGGTKTITVEGVRLTDVAVSKQGSVLAVCRFESKLPHALRGQGTGLRVTRAFEDAAVEVGRLNGAKKVTVVVGIIPNPGWRQVLEARGYVYVTREGGWIKTITPWPALFITRASVIHGNETSECQRSRCRRSVKVDSAIKDDGHE